jgi:hypothetical protein
MIGWVFFGPVRYLHSLWPGVLSFFFTYVSHTPTATIVLTLAIQTAMVGCFWWNLPKRPMFNSNRASALRMVVAKILINACKLPMIGKSMRLRNRISVSHGESSILHKFFRR